MERIGFIGLGAMGKPMTRNLMNETLKDGQGDMDNSSFLLLLEKLSNPSGISPQPREDEQPTGK